MVEDPFLKLRVLDSATLIGELQAALRPGEATALAFDADGTLWSGDIGDDVFRFAVAHGRLREQARARIEEEARKRGFPILADVNATARSLFDAYLAGRYVEREMCELMTWCYAGHSRAEMTALANEALTEARLAERLHHELAPVLDFARGTGLRAIVISASPRPIVEYATRLWGFSPADICASTPLVEGDRIMPHMAGAVPYAAAKCVAGRALLGNARWLAAFGDNVFDLEMMCEAERGIAVRPKPALQARFAEIPQLLLLSPEIRETKG